MCVSAGGGALAPAAVERCLVATGCARRYLTIPLPLVMLVDDALPSAAAALLSGRFNVTLLRADLNWQASPTFPTPPRRLYTFHKLRVWRLSQYQSVLWFDSDAFFTADPADFLDRYQPFAAAFFPMHPAGARSFNSGLMLLQPSAAARARILATWRAGNYTAHLGLDDLTEQDLLISVFGDEFHHMDTCDNFRGRHRPYHRNCVAPPTLHGARFVSEARDALPLATREAIRKVVASLPASSASWRPPFTAETPIAVADTYSFNEQY